MNTIYRNANISTDNQIDFLFDEYKKIKKK